MSMVGQPEPTWCATAYLNGKEVQTRYEDYAGKWHVLYWYPLDFTFVCPTEIKGFQSLLDQFEDEETEVIGASTDSFYSHKNWFQDRETFPEEITHLVIADTNHAVSREFGVLNEEKGVAYRATAIVDDEGLIRAFAANDLSVGRSPAEVLRTLQALRSGGLCGADWKKGEPWVK
jgi:peroxiredoxin (alkyl hydroperoxide reductase subunit C)